MEKEEERIPFQTDDIVEDMMGYARKLGALGELISAYSWLSNESNKGEEDFMRCAQELGMIIKDYAEGLDILLKKANHSFVDIDKNIVFSLTHCQEVYEFTSQHKHKPDVYHIDYQMKELDSFIHNAAMPAFDLKNKFESLRNEIIKNNAGKSVSAAATS